MEIPDRVIKEAFFHFPSIVGQTYTGYILQGAEVVAEWAENEMAKVILDIHRERHGENEHGPYTVCRGCSASPYPCDTVKAIRALTGDE